MLRIGDHERDQAATALGEAYAQGRLTEAEYEERIALAQAAKTHADLEPLLGDLPTAPLALPNGHGALPVSVTAAPRALASTTPPPQRLVAVFGGQVRKGAWQAPARLRSITVFGGAELDLREATLPAEVVLSITCVFGGIELVVPPWVAVDNQASAFLGGIEVIDDPSANATPKTCRLIIKGFAMFGGVEVSTRLAGESAADARRRRKGHAQRQLGD